MPRLKKALLLPEQAAPPTPPSGSVALYSTDGTALLMKDDAGTVRTIGPGAGGGGSGSELSATTDYTTTQPANPSTGLILFARNRARRLPAFVGPLGQDSQLQPALFSNRVGRYTTVNNNSTFSMDGLVAPTVYTTAASAVALASTNFYSAMARVRFPSAATAGAFAGFRIPTAQWFLSSTANMGGFFWVFRFGINAVTATGRGFVGLSATTASEANSDPTALLNRIGFGFGTGSANWYFHSAGAAANATTVDLGASFPARSNATDFFEFRLFAPSGAGQSVYWSAHRLNDGAFTQGGPVTTNLPAVGTLLTHHAWLNNVTAAAVALDAQSLYIETDN